MSSLKQFTLVAVIYIDIRLSCKQNLVHLFCVSWSLTLSFFERFGNQAVQPWPKRDCISGLNESLLAGGVKKRFCLCGNLRREFTLSIKFKVIDLPDRLSSKIHPRYFTFPYCLISVPLYTIFKDLSFRSLCLVPNTIEFVLSCPKCILDLL